MTTKTKTIDKEEVEIKFEDKLANNVKSLEQSAEKAAKELQQYIGALDYAKFVYAEYLKENKIEK